MNLVEIGKMCGILFFMFMFWYFIYVVFKSNNEFLSSLIGINEKVVENFSSSQLTDLENIEKQTESKLKSILATLQLDEDGKSENVELLKRILEKKLRLAKLQVSNIGINSKNLNNSSNILSDVKFLEKALEWFDTKGEDSSSGW
tara:strand:- start:1321 stop:1755 length:435 start_codon:yes stop_codon:yes gene_type:complete